MTLEKLVLCLAVLLLGVGPRAPAQTPDLPARPALVAAALAHPLPQIKIGNCDEDATTIVWQSGITIHQTPHRGIVNVTGQDRQGRAWSVMVPGGSVMECEIWAATLRKGYAPDLVFFENEWLGRNVGELTILFFNRDGRPYPWQATGEWTETGSGVEQLALDEATGNAALVYPVREGDPFSPGYVYSLFRIGEDGIAKVVDKTWPVMSGDPKALVGTERMKTQSELFTTPDATADKGWLRLRSAKDAGTDDDLLYSDGSTSLYPAMVVLDRADGTRRMYLDGDVLDAIKVILAGGYRVKRQGQTCEEEECRPFALYGIAP